MFLGSCQTLILKIPSLRGTFNKAKFGFMPHGPRVNKIKAHFSKSEMGSGSCSVVLESSSHLDIVE